ncbi:unnamed protein product [Mytilus edulis]|uniref:Uncharacterized protein n=1 Tax=Mytilus edulis TaxID=6550 RepID=A0A8S3SL33_MYTED|nr:unnamed protein product [Mytilus edulis]
MQGDECNTPESLNLKKRRRRNSSRPSPQNTQIAKKTNLIRSTDLDSCTDSMAATNQQPIVSISDSDIAKIAIAVKQILTDDFKALIEEKQRPILFELAEIKQKQTELEFSYGEDVKNFKNQIDYLKIKCDELEQHSRKQCVRLSGVPYTLGENTNTNIIEIANKLGVDMQPNDILISHRTGRAKPRQIIARIPNHNLKKKLLKASKQLKDRPDLQGISINQDLTVARSGLAYEARQLVRRKKIKSTFVVDGKIYVYDLSETRHVIRNEIEFSKMLSVCHIDTDISDDESTPEKQPVSDEVVMGNGN